MLGGRNRPRQGPGRCFMCVTWRLACFREGLAFCRRPDPRRWPVPAAPRKTRVGSGEGVRESGSPWLVLYQWEPQKISTRSESLRVSPEVLCAAGCLVTVMLAGGDGGGGGGRDWKPPDTGMRGDRMNLGQPPRLPGTVLV